MKLDMDITERDFLKDILNWNVILQTMKRELPLLNNLLYSYDYTNTQPNMIIEMERFEKEIPKKEKIAENLKNEVFKFEQELSKILEGETVSSDSVFYEKYDDLKIRVEQMQKNFKKFKKDLIFFTDSIL